MLLLEALPLNKCLLGEMKYIYKMKSLKGHYTITWWITKLSKKRLDENNNDNNKTKTKLSLEAVVLTYVLKNVY